MGKVYLCNWTRSSLNLNVTLAVEFFAMIVWLLKNSTAYRKYWSHRWLSNELTLYPHMILVLDKTLAISPLNNADRGCFSNQQYSYASYSPFCGTDVVFL